MFGGQAPSGSGSQSQDRDGEDERQPKPKRAKVAKTPRAQAAKLATLESPAPVEADAPASSSSWLFGGKPRAAKGKGSKELDSTDKVLQQYESLKKMFGDETNFMAITYNKVTIMAEKVESRSTDELQKYYREASSGPEAAKSIDIMRRLAQARNEVAALCQLVSAIHDAEATAATLRGAMDEAAQAGLTMPPSLVKMQGARVLQELFKAQRFSEYFETLQSKELLATFGEDQAQIVDFQFCAVTASITKCLQQEVQPPGFENFDKEMKESAGKMSAEEKERKATDSCRMLQIRRLQYALCVPLFRFRHVSVPLELCLMSLPSCPFLKERSAAAKLFAENTPRVSWISC